MDGATANPNPFIRYRHRLDSYQAARSGRLSDSEFVDLVAELDTAVAAVAGTGFVATPLIDGAALVDEPGRYRLSVKVEIDNVSGSHKSRHLFGVAIHQAVSERLGASEPDRFAIASCGNAALGAATVAAGLGRRLDVFVPVWADRSVVERLDDLGATITTCERRPGEEGDPCYLRFREAVEAGATAFGVQGSDTPTTFDGGRTIGWEIADQVAAGTGSEAGGGAGAGSGIDAVYVQVGGGALATAVGRSLPDSRLHPVQAEGCAPLARAWQALSPGFDFELAETQPERYMYPWADPTSLASGILDDITYDWLPVLRQTLASGGEPVVAPESAITAAWERARSATGLAVSPTGTAGYAGLVTRPPADGEHVVVLFTGADRS